MHGEFDVSNDFKKAVNPNWCVFFNLVTSELRFEDFYLKSVVYSRSNNIIAFRIIESTSSVYL